jgi:hypothetical protein
MAGKVLAGASKDVGFADYREVAANIGGAHMIPRIKQLNAMPDYRLRAVFDGGEEVVYDVRDDIATIPDFSVLRTETGLFENFRLDESRTVVSWSESVDLPSDTILEYGEWVKTG